MSLLFSLPGMSQEGTPGLKLSERWVFVSHNFMVEKNVADTIAVLQRAAKAGYNGILLTDCKFERWNEKVTVKRPEYDNNVRRLRAACRDLKLKAIACVCGQGSDLLSNDPNLAEGMPVVDALFAAKGGLLVPADEDFKLVNPSFDETARENQPVGWNVDFPGKCAFVDTDVKCAGKASLRFQDIRANSSYGNGRANQSVKVKPWRYYHASVMVRTENFDSPRTVNIMALAKNQCLNHQLFDVAPTQDWKRYDITFNTLDNAELIFHVGSWGGQKGKIWFDDIQVEPGGFVNLIRRPSLTFKITSEDGVTVYEEGKDFTDARDPKMGNVRWPGDYDYWHEHPKVPIPAGSRIPDGRKVLISYSHSMNVYGWGIFACMNEPRTLELTREQLGSVHKIVQPDGYMLTHDEIRHMGWDESCRKSGLTPLQTLTQNVKACTEMIRREDPGKPICAWSDMFDPYHNATRKGAAYYLVRGMDPWHGSWEALDKDIVIVNWHGFEPQRLDSLRLFADRGHKQILAGYYDAPSEGIAPWLKDAAKVKGVIGVVYTTWARNFGELERFIRIVDELMPPAPR